MPMSSASSQVRDLGISSSFSDVLLVMFFGNGIAVPGAGVVGRNAMVERDVENRLLLAVIFVRQLSVLELHCLAFGQERDLDRVFAGSFFSGSSGALRFFF